MVKLPLVDYTRVERKVRYNKDSHNRGVTMDIIELFKLGMKRDIPPLVSPDLTNAINLGAGNQVIEGVRPLDLPEWEAEYGVLPERERDLTAVFAFHFFEHISSEAVISLLRDIQKKTVVGGTLNIVVPHGKSDIAIQDLDHRTFYLTETWKTLFNDHYYNKHHEVPWKWDIGTNIVIGVAERNTALMTQLIRRA
jgi:hypothetical protein